MVKKVAKLDNATDHLVEKKQTTEKAVWEKSIGTLSSKKGGLGILVKKKTNTPQPVSKSETTTSVVAVKPLPSTTTTTSTTVNKPTAGGSNALGLLGSYSGSSSDSDCD